jgi:hypothetical protein
MHNKSNRRDTEVAMYIKDVNFVYYGYTVIFDINNLLIVLSEHFLHLSSIPFRLNLVFEDSRVFLYEYY